ncbi:MAG: 23S rRNA (pseudouridine(1915)-N(3))-methyltransferase RlmH [Bacteroidales bacterium]|jgi:23S rRNA (pseudouridine1915-N3)-methyltransferase|nr:23S rRNA (pseudouridine(1915)-N(3))-methyltransferase RlmH [Bacteroidales bacterium]
MKLVFIQTGKTTEKHVAEGVSLYHDRIRKITNFELVTLPGLKSTGKLGSSEVKRREGKQLLEFLPEDSYLILLDDKGREFTTSELAAFMKRSLTIIRRNIVFVAGGAWGFSPEVYSRAEMKLSLSRLTFPHQLVRLLFMEQLYRVLTIIEGTPYHHE